MNDDTIKDQTIELIREAYARVVYTQTTHDYDILINMKNINRLKWINVALTGITFGGILSTLAINDTWLKFIVAFISSITLGVSTYQLSFNPEQALFAHRVTSKELWFIREQYKNLIGDISKGSVTESEAVSKRDSLLEKTNIIYKFAPKTSSKAYLKAQNALQKDEEQTFKTGEIDNFLPKSLKRDKNNLI